MLYTELVAQIAEAIAFVRSDDPALFPPRKFSRPRRAHDPDGLPLATDPTVLDGDALTSTPEHTGSLLLLPPVRKRDGKQRARDAAWLRDVWSTPEWARLALRTRPTFEQVANGQPAPYSFHLPDLLFWQFACN